LKASSMRRSAYLPAPKPVIAFCVAIVLSLLVPAKLRQDLSSIKNVNVYLSNCPLQHRTGPNIFFGLKKKCNIISQNPHNFPYLTDKAWRLDLETWQEFINLKILRYEKRTLRNTNYRSPRTTIRGHRLRESEWR